jgi:aryl-alcohol dehydrogenase-like predicted oxidoreductase
MRRRAQQPGGVSTAGPGRPSRFGRRYGLGQDEVPRLVRRALEAGVNFSDTTPDDARSEGLIPRE